MCIRDSFKIVRPKQQAAMDEDEFEDDGYGEDYEQDSAYSDALPYDEDEESTKAVSYTHLFPLRSGSVSENGAGFQAA